MNARIRKLTRVLERAQREPALSDALKVADTEHGRDVLAAIMQAAAEIAAGARS